MNSTGTISHGLAPDGFELVDPGLVEVSRWGPDAPEPAAPAKSPWTIVGGVGRKP
jgi:hypothetical protein